MPQRWDSYLNISLAGLAFGNLCTHGRRYLLNGFTRFGIMRIEISNQSLAPLNAYVGGLWDLYFTS